MPLYPYRCTKCSHRFEKIQSFSSDPETECPECGGVLERTLTVPRLSFKGTGWYVNDYAAKSGSSNSGGSSESAPKAETKASGSEGASSSAPLTPAAAPAASSPASSSGEAKK